MSRKLLLIDSYGFMFRAFYSLPQLKTKLNQPIGAIYGFVNMISKILSEQQTAYIAMVCDSGKQNFRHEIYPEYKSNRPSIPNELIEQLPLVKEVAEVFKIKYLVHNGYEADDLIATAALSAAKQGDKVTVISSDKDLMQLITQEITMFDAAKSHIIDEQYVQNKFGVSPNKLLDVFSLAGDSSDNIPGVPGIGPKTAAQLINEFGSLQNLLLNYKTIKQEKKRQLIQNNIEKINLSRQLLSLEQNAPINTSIEDFKIGKPDPEQLSSFIYKYEFNSLTQKIEKFFNINIPKQYEETAINFQIIEINTQEILLEITQKIVEIGKVTIEINDNEELFISCQSGEIYCLKQAYNHSPEYNTLYHNTPPLNTSNSNLPPQSPNNTPLPLQKLTPRTIAIFLQNILEDESILKISTNIKAIQKKLPQYKIHPFDDLSVMSYIISSNSKGEYWKKLLSEIYKNEEKSITQPTNNNESHSPQHQSLTASDVKTSQSRQFEPHTSSEVYAGSSLFIHQKLTHMLFMQNSYSVYELIDKPLIQILIDIENIGVKINQKILIEMTAQLTQEIEKSALEIFKLAKEEFNIASTKQLGQILFEKLQLPKSSKSKAGNYKIDHDALMSLSEQNFEIADKILHWRQLAKLKSTYTEGLLGHINQQTGKIHTTYSIVNTNTGRLSSNNPNLQNLPMKNQSSRKVRKAFVAEKNCSLISADYSQIELRILAHVGNVEKLKKAFLNNEDVHSSTASEIFNTPIAKVTDDLRRKAKIINFGIIYGISPFGLTKQLNITPQEAKEYIANYFAKYIGIEEYMNTTIEYAQKYGFVKTVFGRQCYIANINNNNHIMRKVAERSAINAPIQGTAADIIKKAMIELHKILPKYNANIIMQIHDELIIQSTIENTEKVKNITQNIMENVVKLEIPLIVNTGYSFNNWFDIN